MEIYRILPIEIIQKILFHLDSPELFYDDINEENLYKVTTLNKLFSYKIANDDFWYMMIRERYPELFNKTGTNDDIKEYMLGNTPQSYFFNLKYKRYRYVDDIDGLLFHGVLKSKMDLVIITIAKGADINNSKFDLLFMALRYGELNMVKYLVEHGASSYQIHKAYDQAYIYGYEDIMNYLSKIIESRKEDK